jgi:hypothetical protein
MKVCMTNAHPLSIICAVLLLWSAAQAYPQQPLGHVEKPLAVNGTGEIPAPVEFAIEPITTAAGSTQFLATYTNQGKTAKFRVELGLPDPKQSNPAGFKLSVGNGRIVAMPESDASVLLVELKKALEAKHLPAKVKRAASLPFSYVILGEHQSRTSGDGFNQKPAGGWTAMKIFIPANGDDGEVFLNFSLADHKAEFSLKDPDYGNYVLAKLATVL